MKIRSGRFGNNMAILKGDVEREDIAYIHKKAKQEFKKLAGNKVLLLGANGFLGYYFMKSMLEWNEQHPTEKIELTTLSTFTKGVPAWLKKAQKEKKVKILKKDVTKYKVPTKDQYDYIIHGATIASPTYYRLHPIETINANVQGLYHLLDYLLARKATKQPVKSLLFFSTSEIYGNPDPKFVPTPETYNGNVSCTGPRACYDESKRFCETLCVNYAQVHKLPITVARPFNNYGPGLRMNDKRVIPDFATNILNNKDIVMLSDGSPKRTFCYVADAIVGYIKILVSGKPGEAYNIGIETPEISMKELALKMQKFAQKEFGYKGQVITQESKDKQYLTDNPQRRCPKIDKAKNDLGFDPEVTIDHGLANILTWYKENSL